MECQLCELPGKLNAIKLDKFWTVNVAEHSSDRPWIVLQTVRHVPHIDKLSNEEAAALGLHVKKLSAHLSNLENVNKVHIYQLNENTPGHVHFHMTVSTLKDKKDYGTLLSLPMPQKLKTAGKKSWIPRSYKAIKPEPSFLVRNIVAACNFIKKWIIFEIYGRSFLVVYHVLFLFHKPD